MQKEKPLFVFWATILILYTAVAAGQSVETAAPKVLEETLARQEQVLRRQAEKPYPPDGMWHYIDQALGAYWTNQKTQEANAGLIKCRDELAPTPKGQESFHWQAYLLERIYWLFAADSKHFPGRMSTEAEEAVLDMLWDWAGQNCRIEMALPERVWWCWGSENHHGQAWTSFWGAAQIFKNHPDYKDRRYADGSTPAAMSRAFDEYYKLYALERASKGLLVEINSPGYAKYTLGGWYNMADFAEDPVLKKRMSMLLELFWANWAIEQIDGSRGGSRHRCYAGRNSISGVGGGDGMSWFHFGLGAPRSAHPGHMCAATTFWRPSTLVTELALDWEGRGEYAYVSRRPGLKKKLPEGAEPLRFVEDAKHSFHAERGDYSLKPEGGSLLRYTWFTPDFVMGMSMVKPLTMDDWTAISSQNRWNGVIFGGHPTARIFTQPFMPKRGSVYNAEWGVQNKGAMILQRLTSSNAEGQMVWFDKSLKRVERDGWVFAEAPRAYAAVKILKHSGNWHPDSNEYRREGKGANDAGEWFVLNNVYSPVVIEVARKEDFADFTAFQDAILTNTLKWEGKKVEYHSRFYNTTLSLMADASESPKVDGKRIDFTPTKVYDSPYLQGDFGSGVVTIQFDGQKKVLNFNQK